MVAWLPLRSALQRLTFDHDHQLVEQCLEQPTDHPADPAAARQGDGPQGLVEEGRDPSAQRRGRRQAQQVSPVLAAYGIQRLVSSGSTRCVTTLAPYASKRRR